MKKIFLSLIALACLSGMSSCSDMLDVDSPRQVENPSLDQKTDSVYYAYGVAQAMQQLADQYFFQNEMRGDLVKPTSTASVDLKSLSNFTAGTDCKYDSVYLYYKVINNCNYYLANRDTTLVTGDKNVVMNEYVAMAAYRAWAYLQLTHQYGDVPYVTEPMLTISQINSVKESTDYKQILASQAEYLQSLKNRVTEDQLDVPYYRNRIDIGSTQWGGTVYMYPSNLFIPLNVVLGDLYLEMGEYKQAALAYFDYLRLKAKTQEGNTNIGIGSAQAISTAYNGLNTVILPADYNEDQNKKVFDGLDALLTEYNNGSTRTISYIPMAVNFTKGQVTSIPAAFGYDFYGSATKIYTIKNPFNGCPQSETMDVLPSDTYMNLAFHSPYYYYTEQQRVPPYRWNLSQANLGDARSNSVCSSIAYPENVYVTKPSCGNVLLYRNVTVYLHLAEAFNRMGYPEIAFAILKNGLHTGIKAYVKSNYVEGAGIDADNYYIPDEAYQMLVDEVPFFSEANQTIFTNTAKTAFIGVHARGAGAVSDINSPYQYKSIVEGRIEKIRADFGVGQNGQEYTKDEYINAVEDLLCDEYALEFAFEGSRFSDLLRIARHKNMSSAYGADFGDTWLSKKLESKAAGITTKNCYLPFK